MNKNVKIILYVLFAIYELFCLFGVFFATDGSGRVVSLIFLAVPLIVFYIKHLKKNNPKKYEELMKHSYKNQQKAKKLEEEKIKTRIADNKENAIACCPKCGSTSLSANKKGFGIGKAVVGASLTGGLGLTAGNIGAKKVRITCMNCGYDFFAGKQ